MNKKNFLLFTFYFLLLLVICGSGCSLFSMDGRIISELKKKNDDLQQKLQSQDGDLSVAKTELERLKNETLAFMDIKDAAKSLNFRLWSTIKPFVKFVVKGLYQMVIATWLWDFIRLMGWIVFLTWISNAAGKLCSFVPYLKAVTFWMLFEGRMKIITSVIWAFILSWLWKWTHSPADYLYYCLPVSALACAFANFAWEYVMNKTTASERATGLAKNLLSAKAVEAFNI